MPERDGGDHRRTRCTRLPRRVRSSAPRQPSAPPTIRRRAALRAAHLRSAGSGHGNVRPSRHNNRVRRCDSPSSTARTRSGKPWPVKLRPISEARADSIDEGAALAGLGNIGMVDQRRLAGFRQPVVDLGRSAPSLLHSHDPCRSSARCRRRFSTQSMLSVAAMLDCIWAIGTGHRASTSYSLCDSGLSSHRFGRLGQAACACRSSRRSNSRC